MTAAESSSPRSARDLDNEFWRFSLGFYARSGVSSACLELQNSCGVDVNLLLLAIFAAVKKGRMLSAEDHLAADQVVAAWRTEIVEKLRQIRTRLKEPAAAMPPDLKEHLRDQIKAAELKAEQIEQSVLLAWLDRRGAFEAVHPTGLDADELLRRVLEHKNLDPAKVPPSVRSSFRTLGEIIYRMADETAVDAQASPGSEATSKAIPGMREKPR